jgi:GntR family transcriptional regulator, transcriptional repressor for pyruvate dehydrogenase complex
VSSIPRVATSHVIRAPKTAELIAGYLRSRIVRGELTPDDTLPSEADLMVQFGVSRPTLREAFRILETESLISVRRGSRGGARVVNPDLSVAARYVGLLLQIRGTTIVDVYQARTVLEPPCARMLAQNRKATDIADLRACIQELSAAVEADLGRLSDPARWAELTYRFHELLMQRSGNKTVAVLGGVLADIVRTHLTVAVTRNFDENSRAGFRRTIKSYTKLVQLVEARDAGGAEAHWRNHMEVAAKHILGDDLKLKPVVDLFT